MIDTAGARRIAKNLCRNRLIAGHLLYKKMEWRGGLGFLCLPA
jgi:hypothetical protein